MIPGYFSFLSAHDILKRTAWTLFFCLTTEVYEYVATISNDWASPPCQP